MATLPALIISLRLHLGDNDPTSYNFTDAELQDILTRAASGYSRTMKYSKFDETNIFDVTKITYPVPTDSLKVVKVEIKSINYELKFQDNIDQLIILDKYFPIQVTDILRITYFKYFLATEVFDRELDLLLLYAEALCYKLMSTKTADLVKFTTGEKTIDESLISKKYLDLYKQTITDFNKRVLKAYGKRADNILENFDKRLPYPPEGERL